MGYIFANIFLVSLLKPDEHVETKTSIVFLYVLMSSFLGIILGVRYIDRSLDADRRKIIISLIGNSIYTLLVFLLLLLGALIV